MRKIAVILALSILSVGSITWGQIRPQEVSERMSANHETIMAIAGHVSRSMLSHYAHIRTEAKR